MEFQALFALGKNVSNRDNTQLFPLSAGLERLFLDAVSDPIDAHTFQPRGFMCVVGPLIGCFRLFNDFLFHSIRGHGGEVIFLHTICRWLSISSASELRLLIPLRRYFSLD